MWEVLVNNNFSVTATANDFAGNVISGSRTVYVNSSATNITGAKVVNWDSEGHENQIDVTATCSTDLIGSAVEFYDGENYIHPASLTFKVSPAGLEIDKAGMIKSVSKAGTFTVTATSLDGGKSTFSTKITNVGVKITDAKVFMWDAEADNGNGGKGKYVEADPDSITPGTYGYVEFYDANGNGINYSDITIRATAGMTLTLYPSSPTAAYFASVKKAGKYTVTATTKDGGNQKKTIDVTYAGTTEGYEVDSITYHTGSGDLGVFESKKPSDEKQPKAGGRICEATLSNSNAICIDVFRSDSGVYPYNATLTVSGGTIISKTTGTIVEDGGSVRRGGKYVIKPTKETVDITVNGGGKSVTNRIMVNNGTGKALSVNRLVKTEFIGTTTVPYEKAFTFETSDLKADSQKEYMLVFTSNEAYHKLKTAKEKSAYDTLAALLDTAGSEIETATITANSGARFTTKKLTNYGTVPVGSYKFDVTAVEVIRDDGNNITDLKPLTKSLTVTFTAKAPKSISAKLDKDGKVTISDNEGASTQIPFKANSSYSSIINDGTYKPVLYNNNDKGKIRKFTEYFDVTVSSGQLSLTRTDAVYNWTDAEKKKGETTVVGWVEYTVRGEDWNSTCTYCEKVTATLKYKGN